MKHIGSKNSDVNLAYNGKMGGNSTFIFKIG